MSQNSIDSEITVLRSRIPTPSELNLFSGYLDAFRVQIEELGLSFYPFKQKPTILYHDLRVDETRRNGRSKREKQYRPSDKPVFNGGTVWKKLIRTAARTLDLPFINLATYLRFTKKPYIVWGLPELVVQDGDELVFFVNWVEGCWSIPFG